MKRKNQIKTTLEQISRALDHYIRQDEDPALLTGYSGAALFYAYYYRLTGKSKHLANLNFVVEKTLSALSEQDLIFSHCSGISGILWGIQHLVKNGFIEQDEAGDIFLEADRLLLDYMHHNVEANHYDFLHEGLGTALYFVDKLPDPDVERYLTDMAMQLERASESQGKGISWRDNFTNRHDPGDDTLLFNLGLAHGVPAILSVLSMLYEKGINRGSILPLIQHAVRWLMSTKNNPAEDVLSLFPSMVTAGNKAVGARQSRLGWCYGDLSIAVCLWNLGSRLQDDSYKTESRLIFEHVLTHRNSENGKVKDASLCHGSMGISHIFRRMYKNTGDDLFLKGSDLWLDHTLAASQEKEALTGFNYFAAGAGYQDNYTLLEGLTGIGLALIAAVDKETTPAWDRCLLLS